MIPKIRPFKLFAGIAVILLAAPFNSIGSIAVHASHPLRFPLADPPTVEPPATNSSGHSIDGSGSNQDLQKDWPQFLGPRFDGTSQETGIRKDWSKGQLPVLWSCRLGTSYGIGSVSRGRYFQFHRFGNSERLTCLNALTGQLQWNAEYPVQYEDLYGYNNGPRTSPTISGDLIFTMGVAGRLTCWNFKDGSERWAVDTSKRYGVIQNFFGVGCSPLVIENLVIVMVGGSPAADRKLPPGRLDRVSPNGSAIVAFDRETGEERFKVGNYLASYASLRPVEIDGQKLLLCFVREGLLAINLKDGSEAWMYPWRADMLESVNASMPVVQEDHVFVSECYQVGSSLLRFTPRSYEVLRTDPTNRRLQSFRAHWSTPLLIGNYLFGCSGRNPGDSDFRCIDFRTGEVAWTYVNDQRSSVLGIDGHMIVLGENGSLDLIEATPKKYAVKTSLDLSTRDVASPNRPPLSYPCWAAPIVSHGLMYIRGDENLICFELIPSESDSND